MSTHRTSSLTTAGEYMEELLLKLPRERTAVYREAMSRKSSLSEFEVDPNCFLRMPDSANRLCNYWEYRKLLFKENWLRPIVLNEGGAFTAQDIRTAEYGIIAILPNDFSLRSLVFIDLSRAPSLSNTTRDKLLFWALQRVFPNPKSQEDGVIFVIQLVAPGEDLALLEKVLELEIYFPFKIRALHFVTRSANQLLPNPSACPANAFFHVIKSKAEGRVTLGNLGLPESAIPRAYGGQWSYETAFQAQIEVEKKMSNHTSTINSADTASDFTSVDFFHSIKQNVGERRSQVRQTASVQNLRLQKFMEATALIDEKEKKLFLLARERAPILFESGHECDPLYFLTCDHFEYTAAAKRMCTYWNERVKYFKERAFLPLIHTGQGALSQKECHLVRTAFNAILLDDDAGNAVLLQDNSRLPEGTDIRDKRRASFYLMAALCRSRPMGVKGYRYIVLINGHEESYTTESASEIRHLMTKAFPLRPVSFHMVHCADHNKGLSFFEYVLPRLCNIMALATKNRVRIHTGQNADALGRQLVGFGMRLEGLPPNLGGSWNYNGFLEWLEEISKKERETYHPEGSSGVPEAEAVDLGGVFKSSTGDSDMTDLSEGVERYKKRRAVYSRRQRKRQKDEVNRLNETYSLVLKENMNLKKDNEHLEALLLQAQALVKKNGTFSFFFHGFGNG